MKFIEIKTDIEKWQKVHAVTCISLVTLVIPVFFIVKSFPQYEIPFVIFAFLALIGTIYTLDKKRPKAPCPGCSNSLTNTIISLDKKVTKMHCPECGYEVI